MKRMLLANHFPFSNGFSFTAVSSETTTSLTQEEITRNKFIYDLIFKGLIVFEDAPFAGASENTNKIKTLRISDVSF